MLELSEPDSNSDKIAPGVVEANANVVVAMEVSTSSLVGSSKKSVVSLPSASFDPFTPRSISFVAMHTAATIAVVAIPASINASVVALIAAASTLPLSRIT